MARTLPVQTERPPAAPGASATSAAPLAFRRDDGFDVPPAGLLLLATLVGVAGWAWWRRWRLGGASTVSWPPLPWPTAATRAGGRAEPPRLRLLASQRLDGSARVHVLALDGRRYVVACNGQQAISVVACVEPTTETYADPVEGDAR